MATLAVTVITKNESENIRNCLESVKWADEIVVLDSGSLDNTVDICHHYTDKVFITDWQGFGIQKNRAIDITTCEWVLSIDADESVSEELRQEIEYVIGKKLSVDKSKNSEANKSKNSEVDKLKNIVAYQIPRSSSYCGRFMKHSGWSPDYVTRLFQRGYARFSDDLVHERLIVQDNGVIGKLTSSLIHNSFTGLEDVLEKVNAYSSASAQMLYQRGKKGSIIDGVLHGVWSFFYTYVLRAGFLDGKQGFMLAVSSAEVTYYKYVKLMLIR